MYEKMVVFKGCVRWCRMFDMRGDVFLWLREGMIKYDEGKNRGGIV